MSHTPRTRHPARHAFRPRIEELEDRTTPTTFTVTNTNDSGAGSLRQAIVDANLNSEPDIIRFDAALSGATILLTTNASGGIFAPSGLYIDYDTITIDGQNAPGLSISGNNTRRLFEIGYSGTLTLQNLRLTGGRAAGTNGLDNPSGSGGTGNPAYGGAILNYGGILTVEQCTLTGNTAVGGDGGNSLVSSGGAAGNGYGGAIFTDIGTTTVRGSVFTNNVAIGGIGGKGAAGYSDGVAGVGEGGGIYASSNGSLVVDQSSFEGSFTNLSFRGGAIFNAGGSLTLTNSFAGVFGTGNSQPVRNLANVISEGSSTATLVIENSTLFGVTVGGGNATLRNVTIADTQVTKTSGGGAQPGEAAGLTVDGFGTTVNLYNSVVSGNTVEGQPRDISVDPLYSTLNWSGNSNLIGYLNEALLPGGTTTPLVRVSGLFGGSTQTKPPLPGSPVIGAGNPALAPASGTDQRGLPRPTGGPIDIGAFQVQVPTAKADAYTVGSGTLTQVAPGVLGNDTSDPSGLYPLTAQLVTAPSVIEGQLTLNADGSFTFEPEPTFSGSTTFTYQATNGIRTSSPTTVTITGTPATRLSAVGAGAVLGGGPRVRVFNADGSVRYDFYAFNDPKFQGGVRVAVDDVNGDRVDDIIVAPGPDGGPRVMVYNGLDGSVLHDFMAMGDTGFRGGLHVAAGDVNNDGKAEIIVAPNSTELYQPGPRVQVFQASNGQISEFDSFYAYDPNFRGGVRVTCGDVDGDGMDEIATSPGPTGGPDIHIYHYPAGQRSDFTHPFFGFGDGSYRGGAFVVVNRGVVFVAPDSFPTYPGSILEQSWSKFTGEHGAAQPATPSQANLNHEARVYVWTTTGTGTPFKTQEISVLGGAASLTGARLAYGTYQGTKGLFVAAGPNGNGRMQFFPYTGSGILGAPLELSAFGTTDFPASVYVGAGELSVVYLSV